MSEASAPRHFPVFLDLAGRLAVIVGTGPTAEKRVRQLQRAGADIVVITLKPTEALEAAESDGVLSIEKRPYVRGDLDGAFLVLCLEGDEEIQRAVFSEAESRGSLCNVLGAPDLCSFIVPSVVRRGALEIAVSTGGAAPEAAHAARRQIAGEFGEAWGVWVGLIAEARAVAAKLEYDATAARLMEAVTNPTLLERLAAGEEITMRSLMIETEGDEEVTS